MGRLAGKPLGDDFPDSAVDALVGLLAQPLLCELIEMVPAVEAPIADEEVLRDVPDVALVLPLVWARARRQARGVKP